MIDLLSKLAGLGGFLRGSKTILGLLSVGVVAIQHFAPSYAEITNQILLALGVSLVPVGLADKVLRK